MKEYIRKPLFNALWEALHCEFNLIQVVVGPRQVDKTTLALQIFNKWKGPKIYQSADQPDTPFTEWIYKYWKDARTLSVSKEQEVLLILDEVQKINHWSESVKRLFEEDKRNKLCLRIILLGSSALLMKRGLTESLAGRFELHRHNCWSFMECNEYYSLSLDEYIFYGGYPGALRLRKNQERWARYVRDSLIETVLSKDVILMMPVNKPALLRQIFGLAVSYPAQILSYNKMLGQLQDVGNTTTISSYMKLLSNAFLVAALERWSGSKIKQRGSIPKLLVLDNALISAMSGKGYREVKKNKVIWGRMIENAVGARLYTILQEKGGKLLYWRQRDDEIDYVVEAGNKLIGIEVKSGIIKNEEYFLYKFSQRYKTSNIVIISADKNINNKKKGIKYVTIEQFFKKPYESISWPGYSI